MDVGVVLRKEIECALGLLALYAFDLRQEVVGQVAPLLELCHHVVHRLLGPLERLDRTLLGEGHAAGDGVALQLVDVLDVVDGTDGPSDPPSGHGIGLGKTGYGDGPVDHAGHGCHGEVLSGIDHVLVYLVGEYEEVVFHGDLRDGPDGVLGEHAPGRIGGGVEDDHLGLGGDSGLHLLGTEYETVVVGKGHIDGFRSAQLYNGLVGDPSGVGEDDLVPGIQICQGGHEYGLLARGDKHVHGGHVDAVVPPDGVGDRLLELRDPGAGCVMGESAVERFLRRFYDVGRGDEVRFPHGERDDVYALCLQIADQIRDGDGPGCRDLLDSLRNVNHIGPSFPED
ncbi:putative uncharacterized protein [Methanoculleus sp. CAG:1088]|nr:putative uncharacterized protein [Methanoculleus sp. CAG:1088]